MRKVDQEYAVCKISPPMDSFLHGNHKTWPRIVRSTVFDTTATIHTFFSLHHSHQPRCDINSSDPTRWHNRYTLRCPRSNILTEWKNLCIYFGILWNYLKQYFLIFFFNNFHLQFQKKDCNENGIGSFVLDL